MSVLSILGNNIKIIRMRKKISQEMLAEKAGLHATHISRIESGKQNPSLDVVDRIARALDTEAYMLLAPNEAAVLRDVITSSENQYLLNNFKELDEQRRHFVLTVLSSLGNRLFFSDDAYYEFTSQKEQRRDSSTGESKDRLIREMKGKVRTSITLAIDRFPLSKLKFLEELILDLQKLR